MSPQPRFSNKPEPRFSNKPEFVYLHAEKKKIYGHALTILIHKQEYANIRAQKHINHANTHTQ